MEKQGWKVVAIIFVILFVVETLGVVCLIRLGVGEMSKEAKCANEICYNEGYTSYTFQDDTCACWLNGEVKYQEVIK